PGCSGSLRGSSLSSLWLCFKDYASEVATKLSESSLFADVDNGADTPPKTRKICQWNGETRSRSHSPSSCSIFLAFTNTVTNELWSGHNL
ncbi:hypothetical protein BJV78DRAFT_1222692, partial [Lactifluus subvellereus]